MEKCGVVMGLWGVIVGVVSFVGFVFGGIFVDILGWEWIFFVNVLVIVIGLWLVICNVFVFEIYGYVFDWCGVVLLGIGMILLVFGI